MKFKPAGVPGYAPWNLRWISDRYTLSIWRHDGRTRDRVCYGVRLIRVPDPSPMSVSPELRIHTQAAAVILFMRLIKAMELVSEEEAEARWKELARRLRGRDVSNISIVHLTYVDMDNLHHEV